MMPNLCLFAFSMHSLWREVEKGNNNKLVNIKSVFKKKL